MKNLAAKELNYISDFLSWELLSAKKCFDYAQQETDPNHKQMFLDSTNIHQQNYTSLLNYITQVNNIQNNSNKGGRMN
jgi:hypothetical protein